MARSIFLAVALVATASCNPGDPPGNEFMPPVAGVAERSPCPYLNTLANHGFLPRDGFNITREQTNNAFDIVFNVDPAVTDSIFTAALPGSSLSSPDTINLADLNQHGLIEHDASLSRNDAAIGNNFLFNQTIWDTMLAHFPDPLISIAQMAAARADRINAARAANPVINFDTRVAMTSLGETSLVEMIFSDGGTNGGANRQQVDTFFSQERLPFDQGFSTPATRITTDTISVMGQQILDATPISAAVNGTAATGTAATGTVVSGSVPGRQLLSGSLTALLVVAGFAWSWL